jgi:ComF family protein
MFARALAQLLALAAPPSCTACRRPLADAHEVLCPSCRRSLPWLRGARCRRCGLGTPCVRCPARRAAFEAAWAPVAYAGPARELVTALKFRGGLPLADLMAAQIAAGLPRGFADGATLVPVPLHPRRRRVRGYDQAELLAGALARRLGLPLGRPLRRVGAPTRQMGAGRRERREHGRIELQVRGRAPGLALLVDDVHTTGATLDACAAALRTAGARRVAAVTYARALAPAPAC